MHFSFPLSSHSLTLESFSRVCGFWVEVEGPYSLAHADCHLGRTSSPLTLTITSLPSSLTRTMDDSSASSASLSAAPASGKPLLFNEMGEEGGGGEAGFEGGADKQVGSSSEAKVPRTVHFSFSSHDYDYE